jgi:cytochrome b561
MDSKNIKSYSAPAVYLHWIIALFIIAMLITGWSLHYELLSSKQLVFQLYQWHKSIGVVILFLVAARIVWRFVKQPPETPQELLKDEKKIHAGHIGLYALLIVMPLSGWILVSTNPQGIPTILFGYLEWWHLPFDEYAFSPAKTVHYYAAFVISALVIGHVAMAIKHQSQGVALLQRMRASLIVKICLVVSLVMITFLSINVFQAQVSKPQIVNTEGGQIQFSGTNSDNPFSGVFNQWELNTDLNMQSQLMTQFTLSVSLDSATTGSSLYDSTLKEADWFDVANHPIATYESRSATFLSDKHVQLTGIFTLKGKSMPLNIDLMESDDNSITSEFTLKRDSLNLGQAADSSGAWVSNEIQVKANIKL